MMSTQTKIQKHKEHIEKRIYQLQNRLRQPANPVEMNKPKYQNDDLPYRRILVQKQNYVEPEEIKVLRQRQINARESRKLRGRESRRVYEDVHQEEGQKTKIQSRDKLKNNDDMQKNRGRSVQVSKMGSTYSFNNKQIHYPKGISPLANNKQNTEPKEKSQLYDLMTQILTNQKNLEKEIVLLRSQWSRQQNMRVQQKQNNLTPYEKINSPENQAISFQATEPIRKVQFKQQPSKLPNNQQKIRPQQRQKRAMSSRAKKQTKVRDFQQQPTFGIDHPHQILAQQSFSQNQLMQNKVHATNKGTQNPKITKSGKKVVNQQATQQKLATLVKHQRCKNERLVVTQQNKVQFWKQVEKRIKSSEYEYKQSGHRNNRYEHQHLINTNQLQKKLREDIISKIYTQVNNCIYK